jgi:hypothetical protein
MAAHVATDHEMPAGESRDPRPPVLTIASEAMLQLDSLRFEPRRAEAVLDVPAVRAPWTLAHDRQPPVEVPTAAAVFPAS